VKTTFDLMRVWAALTGLALAVAYFVALYMGMKLSDTLPMLIAAIGGFEMVLYGQDIWFKRRRQNG
jgi:zinc transporter ZupT